MAKRRRIDWASRPAPKPGSKLRAAYERSAVYRARSAAAAQAAETKRHRAAQAELRKARAVSKRRATVARRQRIAEIKQALAEPLAEMVTRARERPDYQSDPQFWEENRPAFTRWSVLKRGARELYPREIDEILEELADDWDTDDLGWNIEQSGEEY